MRISEYNAPIAENIERIINEKGLKKAFVAQKAGCTAQMLSDMISGRKIIKACDIVRIIYLELRKESERCEKVRCIKDGHRRTEVFRTGI